MRRRLWLILGAAAGAALMVAIALALVFPGELGYRSMKGPVAIIKGDAPKHGLLGVEFVSASRPLMVRSIIAGTGADAAGLRAGDVVVALNATPTPDYPALQRAIEATSPGDEVQITIRRGSVENRVRVRLVSFAEMVEFSQRERGVARP